MTDPETKRIALIAGGAGGMGAAIAARLCAGGYAVAIADLASDRLAATVDTLAADGGDVLAVPLDMREIAPVPPPSRRFSPGADASTCSSTPPASGGRARPSR
jgi:NAD(P)-dependent dehydrogenase (short-subunit alcohol dehydrogenase family)